MGYRSWKKNDSVTNSSKLKDVSKSREEKNLKEPNAETGRRKGRTEKRQMVTLPMHQEPNEEPNTEEQERESAKEPRTDTKLIEEEEDMSEEILRDEYTSVPPETVQSSEGTGRRD